MKVIIDAEFDSLTPTKIWCIVCKDIDTEQNYVFRFDKPGWEREFKEFAENVSCWVGVNNLVFDGPNINYLIGGLNHVVNQHKVLDLLIVSRLVWYSRPGGHSVRAWGQRFNMVKPEIDVYDDPSMIEDYVDRCEHDVEIQYRIYKELQRFIDDPQWQPSIELEHEHQRTCIEMQENGFSFDFDRAQEYICVINKEMGQLEKWMKDDIPDVLHQDGPIKLKRNKDGRPSKSTDTILGGCCVFSSGSDYFRFHYEPFNPGSAKQRIELLNRSGWKPKDKTKGHLQCERALALAKRRHSKTVKQLTERLEKYKIYGWKVNEENLGTLDDDAPEGARLLATWLSLEGRRADLEEWCAAYNPHSGRIHGRFSGIGSWTGRMSHSKPNQGNIFSEFHPDQCKVEGRPTPVEDVKLRYNGLLRGLWRARPAEGGEPGHYLVGCDAEGIQLRVLAHYIDDPDYTKAIVSGRKEDGTDVHNVNRKLLGEVCRSRDDAKTFIFAWLLGAGVRKVAEILGCKQGEATRAVHSFVESTPGLATLKGLHIPTDAQRGYFIGLDGRKVIVPSEHYVLAGYLQSGESTLMKHATRLWRRWAEEDGLRYKLVDLVHDEWQVEVNDEEVGHRIGQLQCDALIKTGQELGVRCALRGEYKLGINWRETH